MLSTLPRLAALCLFFFLLTLAPARADSPPRVVASILPIHSLVASVMAGVGQPTLLVKGGGSPHSYALRPSEARSLARADLVVWVGPELESFLEKPLSSLGGGAKLLTLAAALEGELLAAREGGGWEEGGSHAKSHHGHGHGATDPHFWLDPRLAGRVAGLLAEALGEADPAHRERYRENGAALVERLEGLYVEMQERIAPVREVPYVVFHDAFQYLERTFELRAAGALTINPDRKPGARRLREIRAEIRRLEARCVFSEPQFEPRLVAAVIEGTGARSGELDPLGAKLSPGPEAYFELLRRLAASLEEGLLPAPP
ncbi:zinc ABC transporter substrate-binding protein [uncultured Desulfuromonas sp.]|uniref:zinc ABC transporter substrate-binding protein n=1 Tax=uncultured Desulfuromonas sp. TaxID=181013 RepID=UPI002618339F|nr:zinc ABC transporter substrate-binding protein [uncultured Desulfuromonas sp.]